MITDSTSTESQAEAYYADLRVWTGKALEARRVQDYCDCYRQLDLSMPANTVGAGADGTAPGPGIMP